MRICTTLVLLIVALAARAAEPPPALNFVIILTDDQGYGDLGSYGHPTIATPVLDRLAGEGQRWTSFYAAPVCTPSRAQLLTGRLAVRSGTAGGVFHPPSTGGLQLSEVTIAEVLKQKGYATGMVGKWHLGSLPQYLPTEQGFDSYYGIPYSNDMDQQIERMPDLYQGVMDPRIEYFNVPLLRGKQVVERPADQRTITRRYTDEAIRFIRENRRRPFFLYLAHNMPHAPLFRSDAFLGISKRGVYGDVIEEIDFNVGRLVATLRELQLDDHTVIVFLSDNGPWMPYREQGGSAGLLRGAKGSNWEGGVRVPAIFWAPGLVKPGRMDGIGSELDLLPTIAALAGAPLPAGRVLDGVDLSASLRDGRPSARDTIYYYDTDLVGVRERQWKLLVSPPRMEGSGAAGLPAVAPGPLPESPQLYDLGSDPGEKFNVASAHPDIVERLSALVKAQTASVLPGENQLNKGLEGYFEKFRSPVRQE